jgi:SpoVK/Ycf46/Vps4 family AAA+-type ATPase
VIYGPEGCGKTAFLKQAASALRELGYNVFYLHPLEREFAAEVDEINVKKQFLDVVRRTLADERWGRAALAVFDLIRQLLERRRGKSRGGGRRHISSNWPRQSCGICQGIKHDRASHVLIQKWSY